MAARQLFSMRVTPDQSLLALDSDSSGQWPLVRIRKWWTDTPVTEVLSVPGWSSADAQHLDSIHVDVGITPNGRYAVAFAGANWMEKSAFLLHAPGGYVARKPDTIISVIDLHQWKVMNSIHTTGMADGGDPGPASCRREMDCPGLPPRRHAVESSLLSVRHPVNLGPGLASGTCMRVEQALPWRSSIVAFGSVGNRTG